MLVGNNIALVVYGIFMASLIKPTLTSWVGENDFVILLLQTLISTLIILISAEFIPKTLFRTISDSSLKIFALPIAFFYYLFFPIVKFSLRLSNILSSVFLGVKPVGTLDATVIKKVDLGIIIEENEERFDNDSEMDNELKIFKNALDFSEVRLRECMVPRTEIVSVELSASIEELTKMFVDTGRSKIFVYQDSVDKILGYVSSSDLFRSPKSIKKMVRNVPIVTETMAAQNLLELFIKERRSIAVVVDEFGGTSGIVSFEDILEEIFGEIEDEHDKVDIVENVLSDGSFVFSGRIEIDRLNDKFDLNLVESDSYETLAGYILNHYGNFPTQGEVITNIENDDNTYQILKATDTRIELVKIIR
jgi:CBS domain containing-hemolysin-like protein